jgi:hypothetical protein
VRLVGGELAGWYGVFLGQRLQVLEKKSPPMLELLG